MFKKAEQNKIEILLEKLFNSSVNSRHCKVMETTVIDSRLIKKNTLHFLLLFNSSK